MSTGALNDRCSVNALSSPVAVVSNTLVVTAIWRNLSLRTPSFILLAGLAITDFFTDLITQPAYLVYVLGRVNDIKKLSSFAITICKTVGRHFSSVTMVTIALMAIERWFHWRRPILTPRRVYVIYGVFLLLLVLLSVLFSLHNVPDEAISNFFQPNIMGSFGAISFAVTTFAYFKVVRIIRRHQLQIQANYQSSQNLVSQPVINLTKYRNSVRNILYIMLLFWSTFLTQAICISIYVTLKTASIEVSDAVFHASVTILFLTSSLNPLYCRRMKEIRNEVKLLIRKITCKE